MVWFNKKRKLNYKRLSQFRAGDIISYELRRGDKPVVVSHYVVNNDPDTKSISIKMGTYSNDIVVFNYNNTRFDNIRALNTDPLDYTNLKSFLTTIIANVGQLITESQKTQAEDLIKSYKL